MIISAYDISTVAVGVVVADMETKEIIQWGELRLSPKIPWPQRHWLLGHALNSCGLAPRLSDIVAVEVPASKRNFQTLWKLSTAIWTVLSSHTNKWGGLVCPILPQDVKFALAFDYKASKEAMMRAAGKLVGRPSGEHLSDAIGVLCAVVGQAKVKELSAITSHVDVNLTLKGNGTLDLLSWYFTQRERAREEGDLPLLGNLDTW